jgi:hypothetical protein
MGAVNHVAPMSVRPHRSQPRFGLIKEGVNLLHVVARSGSRELLAVGRMPRQRESPDPEERVANLLPEGVDLRCVIALPQTAVLWGIRSAFP